MRVDEVDKGLMRVDKRLMRVDIQPLDESKFIPYLEPLYINPHQPFINLINPSSTYFAVFGQNISPQQWAFSTKSDMFATTNIHFGTLQNP